MAILAKYGVFVLKRERGDPSIVRRDWLSCLFQCDPQCCIREGRFTGDLQYFELIDQRREPLFVCFAVPRTYNPYRNSPSTMTGSNTRP